MSVQKHFKDLSFAYSYHSFLICCHHVAMQSTMIFWKCGMKHRSCGQESYILNHQLELSYSLIYVILILDKNDLLDLFDRETPIFKIR